MCLLTGRLHPCASSGCVQVQPGAGQAGQLGAWQPHQPAAHSMWCAGCGGCTCKVRTGRALLGATRCTSCLEHTSTQSHTCFDKILEIEDVSALLHTSSRVLQDKVPGMYTCTASWMPNGVYDTTADAANVCSCPSAALTGTSPQPWQLTVSKTSVTSSGRASYATTGSTMTRRLRASSHRSAVCRHCGLPYTANWLLRHLTSAELCWHVRIAAAYCMMMQATGYDTMTGSQGCVGDGPRLSCGFRRHW